MAIKLKITHGNYSAEGTSATVKCNGKKLAEDLVIEAVEVEEVKLISFTVNGKTYYSPEGWTWAEWLTDAKYNTDGFYARTYVCNSDGGALYSVTIVYPDDPNKDYHYAKPSYKVVGGIEWSAPTGGGGSN